jgi:CBS domain containing-hemolysin-like protein
MVNSMSAFIFAILLVFLALLAITLEKTYFYVSSKELRRLAARGDNVSQTLLSAEVYGVELKLVLWLITGLAAAGSFVLFARVAPTLLGFVVVLLALWLGFLWIPRTRLTVVGTYVALWSTPVVVKILRIVHPVTAFVANLAFNSTVSPHTGLYEREDIYELLKRQKAQSDNRISHKDLELLRKNLRFGDYRVRDLVVPRRQVKAVNINDSIGPVLLDELHSSGHNCFPVYEGQPSNVVGTFSVNDLADVSQRGAVRDFYEKRVAYVHANDSVEQALRALNESSQLLLVVVNSANEYVGIVTLSNILHELLGDATEESFDDHHDRKAVAARHNQPEPALVSENDIEKVSPEPSEMVE